MPRARTLLPVLAVAIGLTIAGCAGNGTASSGNASGSGATVAFASPAAGTKVTSPVNVVFTVQGTRIGRPETGLMHLHVHVDQARDYTILYATSGQVRVPVGQHTLKVVLAQANHTETATTATERIDVTGTGGSQAPPTTAGGGGYGYP